MAKKTNNNNHQGSEDYSASDITVMEGLEAVRKRPGMYIGTTGLEGVQHLIHEIVDNGVDEAMAGFASKIRVILNKDKSVTVIDDGRGIPVDIHEKNRHVCCRNSNDNFACRWKIWRKRLSGIRRATWSRGIRC